MRRQESTNTGGSFRQLLRIRKVVVGASVFLTILLFCVVVPLTNQKRVTYQYLRCRFLPPGTTCSSVGLVLMGTDALGRDLTYRIASGGCYSIGIATITALLSALIGAVLGIVAGFFGGKVEGAIMAVADVQLALPTILVALLLVAVLGPGVRNLVLAMVATGWAQHARLTRARVLAVRGEYYVEAARAIGVPNIRILFRHILPQTYNVILVLLTQQIGWYIMVESSLSYLGLGVQVPAASWGNIAAAGRDYLSSAWWISTLPGLMLTAAVSSLFLLGDGLRDFLDPRLKHFAK